MKNNKIMRNCGMEQLFGRINDPQKKSERKKKYQIIPGILLNAKRRWRNTVTSTEILYEKVPLLFYGILGNYLAFTNNYHQLP